MKAYCCIVFVFLLFSCSTEQEYLAAVSETALTGVLTLEQTLFGEGDTNEDEYLLASPCDISVMHNGDIVLADEMKVKVFDNNGKGKKTFGGPGDGPGEFRRPSAGSMARYLGAFIMRVGPEGYISILSKNSALRGGTEYNMFAPDYTFIKKERITNKR